MKMHLLGLAVVLSSVTSMSIAEEPNAEAPAVETQKEEGGGARISPSGKLRFDIRGEEGANELWLEIEGSAKPMRRLFNGENGLRLTFPHVSSDDRLIAFTYGGGSAGRDIELYRRSKDGSYKHLKVNITDIAWSATVKRLRLHKKALFTHLYSEIISVGIKPLSVVFTMEGRYDTPNLKGENGFGARLQYLVESQEMKVVHAAKGDAE